MLGSFFPNERINPLKNPLKFGEIFGPFVHLLSRLFPRKSSGKESVSFQGLTNPRSEPKEILVYDISNASDVEQISARVIQGIMNREKPVVYLVGSEKDEFWLTQITADKIGISELDDSGYEKIVYDPYSIKQKYLAVTLSGIHDAVPVTESSNPLFDITEMTDKEIYDLMLETSQKTSRSMISFRNKENPEHIDFIVKNKIFLSPLAITGINPLLHVKNKSRIEAGLLRSIMSNMEPDSPMIGYNINSGILGEYETINYLSKYGCYSIPVPGVPNLSFFSGFPKAVPKHATFTGNKKLENKTYVVILMSDGDNLDLPYSKYESFSQPHETPLGWSVSPFLNEFAPTMFDYYSSHLPEKDTFVVAPSGGGFGYPSKNKFLPAFIRHTSTFMRESNLEYLWLLDHPIRGYSPRLLEKFAQISSGIFMEYVLIRPYFCSVEIYGGTPAVFSSAFVEKDGDIAKKILRKTPRRQPAFLFIGVEMRYNTPQHIDSEISKLDSEQYEVISVPEFMALVRQENTL